MTAKNWTSNLLLIASALVLGACVEQAQFPVAAGNSPDPELPSPRQSLIPTICRTHVGSTSFSTAIFWSLKATPRKAACRAPETTRVRSAIVKYAGFSVEPSTPIESTDQLNKCH
jgi:hypothetical protein